MAQTIKITFRKIESGGYVFEKSGVVMARIYPDPHHKGKYCGEIGSIENFLLVNNSDLPTAIEVVSDKIVELHAIIDPKVEFIFK